LRQILLELGGTFLDNGNFDGHGNLFVTSSQDEICGAANKASSECIKTNPTPTADETAQVFGDSIHENPAIQAACSNVGLLTDFVVLRKRALVSDQAVVSAKLT
jgi:hypothetical protein